MVKDKSYDPRTMWAQFLEKSLKQQRARLRPFLQRITQLAPGEAPIDRLRNALAPVGAVGLLTRDLQRRTGLQRNEVLALLKTLETAGEVTRRYAQVAGRREVCWRLVPRADRGAAPGD